MSHITVLQDEAVASLALTPQATVVDCTLGAGGHARAILDQLDKNGTLIGIDRDPTAIAAQADLAQQYSATIILHEGNFADFAAHMEALELKQVDAVLVDLGWRMEQFDGTSGLERGFSFQTDEPLHMTYGDPAAYAFTATDIVNDWEEEDIANVIYAYGEERQARRIARFIVEARSQTSIQTAKGLADIVSNAIPRRFQNPKVHPATKTFQALRIAVNDEFDVLRQLVMTVPQYLTKGGRFSIISFHSLEDRIVKHSFQDLVRDQKVVKTNKKPIIASNEEQRRNPRARSAKLRTVEKI